MHSSTTSEITTGLSCCVREQASVDATRFLKADDDTFFVVRNLRRALARYQPQDIHFFGAAAWPSSDIPSCVQGESFSYKGIEWCMQAEELAMSLVAPVCRFWCVARGRFRYFMSAQGRNQWAFSPPSHTQLVAEDLEFSRTLMKLGVRVQTILGPDGR